MMIEMVSVNSMRNAVCLDKMNELRKRVESCVIETSKHLQSSNKLWDRLLGERVNFLDHNSSEICSAYQILSGAMPTSL